MHVILGQDFRSGITFGEFGEIWSKMSKITIVFEEFRRYKIQ